MIAILHNIRSAHNVGSIFRTADAAGVTKLYLCGITPAPEDRFGRPRPEIAKVALGAERCLSHEHRASATRLIDQLKRDGYTIYAVEQSPNSTPYHKIKRSALEKTVLVVGNEIKGLSRSILSRADTTLEIPMFGKKESLNVAVAFGVIAFHLRVSRTYSKARLRMP